MFYNINTDVTYLTSNPSVTDERDLFRQVINEGF